MAAGRLATAVATLGTVALLAACGGGSSSGSKNAFAAPGKAKIKGQTITVLLPYKIPQALLKEFTAKTGVKVNFTVTGWDAVHSKLIVANTAKTYIADVAEFDWSFTGQFAGAKWDEPLEGVLDPALVKDLGTTSSAFTSGGHIYAACYSNDFRMSLWNEKQFQKAGVPAYPKTFDELSGVVAKLKASGVQYPLSIPMGATEGGVTPWYLLTLSMGGQLFDKDFKPLFATPGSAGYKALEWEVAAVKNGWVSPGSVTSDDGPTADKFNAGATSILLAGSPGALATANDPKSAAIAGSARAGLVPGVSSPGPSFGLPEGLAIPVTAKHKDAALAFIQWWEDPAVSGSLYSSEGMLPCRSSVISALAKSGKLLDGQTMTDQLKLVAPLFPQGAPLWYSTFSSDAQGLINAAIKGNMTVPDALKQLAAKATKLASNGA